MYNGRKGNFTPFIFIMEHKLKHDMCLLCGDIHGDVEAFFTSVKKCGDFENTDIIILGDIGLGFYRFAHSLCEWIKVSDYEWMRELDKWAKKNNNDVWVFRGNHDDPDKYKRDCKLWTLFDNIHLLEDGDTVVSHNNKRYLIVGGSISIDRCVRELGFNYWHNEYLNIDIYNKIEEQSFDGVFAHTGPTPPQCLKSSFLDDWDMREKNYASHGHCNNCDRPLLEVIDEERKNIDLIIDKFKPKYWFNGHYHQDAQFEHKGVKVFALDIVKFLELDRYE